MSDGITIESGPGQHSSFTIKNLCGCRIVYGEVPLSEFGMLMHGFSKKALMAADIADRIGAMFVIGEPKNLEELREMNLPVSEKRRADHLAASRLGLPEVAAWPRDGERGASSNAMCKRMFGIPADAGVAYPHDPDDLRRCLIFLDSTNAHDKVSLMADVSAPWAGLVSKWDEVVATFREEFAKGQKASRTFSLMNEILSGAQRS